MEDLVSIIVPIYNGEKYLSECFNSIVGQTYQKIEIIAVNDGSTDRSLEIIKSFSENDKRIIVVDKENQGVSSARNEGLNKAKGDYIVFIDCDDYVSKNLIELTLKKLKENDCDIVVTSLTKPRKLKKNIVVLDTASAIKELNKGDLFYGHIANKIFRKRVIGDIRFNEKLSISEDMVFCNYVFAKAKKVVFWNENFYFYRGNDVSAYRSQFNERFLTIRDAMLEINKFIEKCFKESEEISIVNIIKADLNILLKMSFSSKYKEKEYSLLYSKIEKEIKEKYSKNLSGYFEGADKMFISAVLKSHKAYISRFKFYKFVSKIIKR